MILKRMLEHSRYLVVIGVLLMVSASAAAFIWGSVATIRTLYHIFHSVVAAEDIKAKVDLISIMDTFLIATVLLIFALGLYELFVEDLELQKWLKIHDLRSLEAKLSSVIVLVLVLTFLEHLAEWKDAWDTFLFATAIALVSVALIANGHWGGKD